MLESEKQAYLSRKKTSFFCILYSAARTATLTPQIITEAFRKTRLYPVNCGAVSAEQMPPSTESTWYAAFPGDLASPVKVVLAANRYPVRPQMLSAGADVPIDGELTETDGRTTPVNPFNTNDPSLYTPSKRAKTMNFLLEKTSASFLVEKWGQLTSDKTIPKPIFERPENTLAPNCTTGDISKSEDKEQLGETYVKWNSPSADVMQADGAVAQAKVDAKALKGQKAAITKAKKVWRVRDIADRKKRRAEQVEEYQQACKAAAWAGRRIPKKLKALTRPSMPDNAFFEAEIDAQEFIELSDGLDDEEEEE
ncbi:hypothetical protein FRC00_008648 [Tulasnella sp. 408]|nr:hypothetical protein FRC00_008648 [Tulasnella sp. 408]